MNVRQGLGIAVASLGLLAPACGGVAIGSSPQPPVDAGTVDRDDPKPQPSPDGGTRPGDPPEPSVHQPQHDPSGLSSKCISLVDSYGGRVRIGTLSLDTGLLAEGPAVNLNGAYDVTSIGVVGDKIVACGYHENGRSLLVIDRQTGTSEQQPIPCEAVTSDVDGIWLLDVPGMGPLWRFANLSDLLAKKPSSKISAPFASRLGPGKAGNLTAAWHSADEVLEVSKATENATPRSIDGYDGWIYGVSAALGNRIAVSSPLWSDKGGVLVFDASTGKELAHHEPMRTFYGLWCGNEL